MVGAGAGARAGARASRTALKICRESFLEYLRTLVVATEDIGPDSLLSYSKISDSEGGKESRGTMKRRSR